MNHLYHFKHDCSLALWRKLLAMIAFVMLMGIPNQSSATCIQPPTIDGCDYLGSFDNKFYYKIHNSYVGCPDAAALCHKLGGRLPKVLSSAHNNWLRSLISGKLWIDLSDQHWEGSWKHADVTNPAYTKWALFSPSIFSWLFGANDFCYMQNDGYWKDCDNTENAWTIMEMPCHTAEPVAECDVEPNLPNCTFLGKFGKSFFYKHNGGTYDVHQANAIALSLGGHLPKVKTDLLNNWLKSKVSSWYWADGNDIEKEGTWKHQGGLLCNFFNWGAGEPNNYGGHQHFLRILTDGKWDDANGTDNGTVVIEVPCKGCGEVSAPALTTNEAINKCPSTTVDLNKLTPVFTPTGYALSWHTSTPATDNNKLTTPSSVGGGTYYAIFKNNVDGCYGGEGEKTTKVTATVGSCGNLVRLKNRTYDGTLNNISNSEAAKFGSSGRIYARELPADYADGISALAGPNRPNPRALSNKLSNEPEDIHNDRDMSGMFYIWGQFIDHDMNDNKTNPNEPAPISLPSNEKIFSNPISFSRAAVHPGTGVNSPRQQTNFNTSWLDGSQVYGTSQETADWLRTFKHGRLKTSKGNMLPFNTLTGEYDSPIDPSAPSMDDDQGGTKKTFVAGDHRAAEHSGTTSLHTLFMREHNRICDELVAQGMTDDEEIYQRARKIVGALIQRITYSQWMESMGIQLGNYTGYNPCVTPDIMNTFATGAYRWHTMVENDIILRDNECNGVGVVEIPLRDVFFNINIVRTYDIDVILKGLSVHRQYETDLKVNGGLRNFLFGNFGTDLVSINIQRGRDHGLPSYNDVREFYTGDRAKNFHDISPVDSIADAMASIYDSVDDVDLWVGLYAEPHVSGKSIGKTVHALIASQFEKLRDGDYYFYKNDPELAGMLSQIESTNLDDVISRNTNAGNFQDNVFFRKYCSPEGDDLAKTPCNVVNDFDGWSYIGSSSSSKFYRRDGDPMNFADAKEESLVLAAHLPQVNSHSENDVLSNGLGSDAAWLDMVRSGSYSWRYSPKFNNDDVLVQGSTVSFFKWDYWEPNNSGGNENRVEIKANGRWNDIKGDVLRAVVAEQSCQQVNNSCASGNSAPTLTTITCDNICPATTIDLSNIQATNKPLNSVLTWHTGTPATNSNRITNVTQLSAGTYYASFYSASSNCYAANGHKTAKFFAINRGCGAISIADKTVNENDGTATLTLTLSSPVGTPVTVSYATENGDAQNGDDYVAKTGTVTFPANATSVSITIVLVDDNINEPTESFFVNLSNPNGATIDDGRATVLIIDNDAADPCAALGGDSDGDGVCNAQDCQPFNPAFPATPGSACDDGNANTSNDMVTADGCGCAGTPVNNGPDCANISITAGANSITVTGLGGAPVSSVQIFNSNWQTQFSCFADCGASKTVNLPVGDYFVFAKYYTASYVLICEKQLTVSVGGNDPCAALGGDSDGDGVCNANDCQPFNAAFPATPGTACNDGNPNTTNDVVSANGCGCAGTPVSPPTCDNYTFGGTIGFGSSCSGVTDYCPNGGSTPTIGNCASPIGGSGNLEVIWLVSTTSCSVPTTSAAEIIAGLDPHWSLLSSTNTLDLNLGNVTESACYLRCVRRAGCDTYTESNIISLTVLANCGSGQGTPDCANISIAAGNGQINVGGLNGAPVTSVQIFNSNWQQLHNCFANCGGPSASYPVAAGTYYVYVKYYSANYQYICELNETISVVNSLVSSSGEKLELRAIQYLEHTELIWVHNKGNLTEEYVVERSADGSDFEEIGLQPSERSNQVETYQDFDIEPLDGDNFYRIKLIHDDGSVSFSNVEQLHFTDLADFLIFPNPANDFAKIDLESFLGKQVDIHIFDNRGVRRMTFHLDQVYSKYYQMDLRDLNEGHYVIWVNVLGRKPVAKTLVIGRI